MDTTTSCDEVVHSEALRNGKAIRIQCWYRQRLARLKVNTIRINQWCARRNAIALQCFFRTMMATRAFERAKAAKAAAREQRRREREERRLRQLEEFIQWRGAECHTAARKIQAWARAIHGGQRFEKSKLFDVVVMANSNRAVTKAYDERERLEGLFGSRNE